MNEMSLLAIHINIKKKSCKLSKIKTKTKLGITPILHVSVMGNHHKYQRHWSMRLMGQTYPSPSRT